MAAAAKELKTARELKKAMKDIVRSIERVANCLHRMSASIPGA